MSDTVRDSIYRDVISSARARDLLSSIVSSPLDPHLLLRVIVFEWNKNCIGGGGTGRLERFDMSSTISIAESDGLSLVNEVSIPLPLGRIARNYVIRSPSSRQTDCFVTRTEISDWTTRAAGVAGDCAENCRIIYTRVRVNPFFSDARCVHEILVVLV